MPTSADAAERSGNSHQRKRERCKSEAWRRERKLYSIRSRSASRVNVGYMLTISFARALTADRLCTDVVFVAHAMSAFLSVLEWF